jgi:hypothetical protein
MSIKTRPWASLACTQSAPKHDVVGIGRLLPDISNESNDNAIRDDQSPAVVVPNAKDKVLRCGRSSFQSVLGPRYSNRYESAEIRKALAVVDTIPGAKACIASRSTGRTSVEE